MMLNSMGQTARLAGAVVVAAVPAAAAAQNSSTSSWVGATHCGPAYGNSLLKVGRPTASTNVGRIKSRLRGRFASLVALEDGWDGPASVAPDKNVMAFSARILDLTVESMRLLPAPYVVPVADGGLQAEWHLPNHQLEIYFDVDGDISAWSSNHDTGVEMDEDGIAAIQLMVDWVSAREHDLRVGV